MFEDVNGLATVAAVLAEALLVQGRDTEALACVDLSRREGAPEDVTIQIQWRGPCATALARRGQLDEAERLAREAVELAERTDFLDVHGNALMDLGEVLRLAGRAAEATAAARSALALQTKGQPRLGVAGARRRRGRVVGGQLMKCPAALRDSRHLGLIVCALRA